MSSFQEFLNVLCSAIAAQDGATVRQLLRYNSSTAVQAVAERARKAGWDPTPECKGVVRRALGGGSEWEAILSAHCKCLVELQAGRTEEAFVQLSSYASNVNKVFAQDPGLWVVEVMWGLVHNLHDVGYVADEALRQEKTKRPHCLEACGSQLQKCFAEANAGRGNKSKRVAALEIVNVALKVYFKLNTLRLAKPLINAINQMGKVMDFEAFPAAHRIKYKYYIGRLDIFEERFGEAEQALEYAFKHCHRSAQQNKGVIMYYLVPVKMLLGVLPSDALLQRFGLTQYVDFVAALRTGSVKQLNDALATNQSQLIQVGTYLLLEKLKMAVYRRLFKRTALLHRETAEPTKAFHIPIASFRAALTWQGMDVDDDEHPRFGVK
ncbi:hypothetical protein WJX72_001644 [[Myrmecia] bisecta]|uniref:PCI domain-containing protein 2 n=1 Tax=[Myrmecia] bisecta TaxID=41462 RepID=A0AAW1PRR4_9CHLO